MSHCFDDFTLLVDGREAFPEILACIGRAKKSIFINMFIWRDDEIGCAIARAILAAAERGVKVTLSVDRVGAVLEYAEEHRRSFFHRRLTPVEWVKVSALRLLYPELSTRARAVDADGALYRAILAHPNVTLERDVRKADHSKFYLFDDEVLILGGINIEDKENGADISGRVYQDYMVKLVGARYVAALRRALTCGLLDEGAYGFCVNSKVCAPRVFAMEAHYLGLIRAAKDELLIAMAYFAPPKAVLDAIVEAVARGVRVTLLIPARANFMHYASFAAAARLMAATGGRMKLYLTPKMMHTKLIANEEQISFGSANLMKNAFSELSELNLFVAREGHPFCVRLMESVAGTIGGARQIRAADELRYSRVMAWLEERFE